MPEPLASPLWAPFDEILCADFPADFVATKRAGKGEDTFAFRFDQAIDEIPVVGTAAAGDYGAAS
jgi:hypothetical protein